MSQGTEQSQRESTHQRGMCAGQLLWLPCCLTVTWRLRKRSGFNCLIASGSDKFRFLSQKKKWWNFSSELHQALGGLFLQWALYEGPSDRRQHALGNRKRTYSNLSNPCVLVQPCAFQVFHGLYLIHEKLFLKYKARFFFHSDSILFINKICILKYVFLYTKEKCPITL